MAKELNGGLITRPTPPKQIKQKIPVNLTEEEWDMLNLYVERNDGVDLTFFTEESIRRQITSPAFQDWLKKTPSPPHSGDGLS